MVDDNSFNIVALNMMVEQISRKYNLRLPKVDQALDGVLALEQLQRKLSTCCGQPYKLVFIDMLMPRMSGLQLIEKVRNLISKQISSPAIQLPYGS